MENLVYLILMTLSELLIIFLAFFLRREKTGQIKTVFKSLIYFMMIWTFSLILQILLSNSNIKPVYFEYIAGLGACLVPLSILMLGIVFSNTKIKIKRFHLLFLILPIISLISLWTNDIHGLFFKKYSTNMSEVIAGPFHTYNSIYSYSFLIIGLIFLIKYSIKNAGFFSKQSLLIVFGTLIPIVLNMLGTFNIIQMTVYVTPISFAIAILFYALAIFKFKFLTVTPISMQRIVDRMSDIFIIVNEDGIITDYNETFLRTFHLETEVIRNLNFIDFIVSHKLDGGIDLDYLKSVLDKCKNTEETILVKRELQIKNKYFNIEASGIFSKNSFLGTLILLKDVTQHVLDTNTIKDNQSMLMEKERLASLGQMIGGIAHNLKTPIMSIAGAAEGLTDLTQEYDISIGDPSVTNEDHHEIVKDMNEWIEKVKTHTSYMSDVITAVKGQAVAFADTKSDTFTISELLTHIDVLMKHELKNALVYLNTSVLVPDTLSIKGNINSLVQVINNIISNAIQAYGGKPNKNIDFIIKVKDNNLVFSVQDYGCGMPKKIQDKLFKEMITTKGKNGTGLGLFMSYSNIRAHFNGNMSFESEEGKGTRFDITIPLN